MPDPDDALKRVIAGLRDDYASTLPGKRVDVGMAMPLRLEQAHRLRQ